MRCTEAVSPFLFWRSEGEGSRAVPLSQLGNVFGGFPLIFNTVPAMLLGREQLQLVNKEALIIDLASKPGGDDAQDKGRGAQNGSETGADHSSDCRRTLPDIARADADRRRKAADQSQCPGTRRGNRSDSADHSAGKKRN